MDLESARVVSNGAIEKRLILVPGESEVDVINIDEKEERTKHGALGYSRKDGTRVEKCAINKNPLGAVL